MLFILGSVLLMAAKYEPNCEDFKKGCDTSCDNMGIYRLTCLVGCLEDYQTCQNNKDPNKSKKSYISGYAMRQMKKLEAANW